MTTHVAAIAYALPPGDAPREVVLMPAGKLPTRPNDSRAPWVNDEPDAVVAATSALLPAIKIDYEHQSEHAKDNGQPAPAAGWVTRVFARAGEIVGEVEWTERAAAMIKAKEYKFISPAFDYAPKSRRVVRITGAGLVNDPALYMRAIARSHPDPEETMDLKKLRESLGLADDADEKSVLAAVASAVASAAALKGVAKAAGLADDAEPGDIEKAVAKATAASSGDPDPSKFVPREDHDKALARIDTLEGAAATAQATAAVDAAVKDGKITPAQREWAEAYCKRDADGFAAFVKDAPTILKAGARREPSTGTGTASAFLAPEGRVVDEERMSLHEKALARASADKISYEQAAILEEAAA